jgi:hypothetical protein
LVSQPGHIFITAFCAPAMSLHKVISALTVSAVLAACSKAPPTASGPTPAQASAPAASTPTTSADRWLGRWQGPEATFLEITGSAGAYRVTVQNLDGPRTFDAAAGTDSLSFTRDGVAETVRPGSGADTGMKWLADKRDCLVVKAGEGYCRD